MATLDPLHNHDYIKVVITLCLCHLVYYPVTAVINTNGINGGFSADLIRRSSSDSPWHKHRRLMGPDTPGSLIRTDPNSGAHIMKFSMGTPPFDIYAMADTGSNLLWTQCEPCKACFSTNFGVFDPSKSSTYRKINCRARDCRLVGHFRPPDYEPNYCREDDKRPCLYSYSYADTSTTTGVLSRETVTLTSAMGNVVTLNDIVFGCGYANNESVSSGNEMGVIGLGRGPLSFVSQIAPYVGGKRFSHCLVDEASDNVSKIFFGNGSEVLGEGVVSTPLVDINPDEMNYFVTVLGISFGNEFISYNSTGTRLKKGNVIIDSGTPVARLPQDLFDRMVIQLKKMVRLESFVKHYRSSSTSNLCFNTTKLPELPPIIVHFDGGGKLPLRHEPLVYREDEAVFCFGLAKHTIEGKDFSDVGVYGGQLQTNMFIAFDLEKKMVSFKPTNCDNL